MNDGAEALRTYHESTKHSYWSVRRGGGLDWENEPAKFKTYRGVEPVPLPRAGLPDVPAHEVIARSAALDGGGTLDLQTLSALLFAAAGVHHVLRGRFGTLAFRTYACAGALYPNEVYVATSGLGTLGPGLYHYHPLEHALRLLRSDDLRGALASASALPSIAGAPAVLVFTGIPWRTAWKYGTRGYRHLFWDCGMMLANLLAAAAACEVRTEIVIGFVDADVGRVLGLDGARELPLALVPMGEGAPPLKDVSLDALDLDVEPLSPRELVNEKIVAAHRASSLEDAEAVRRWRLTAPVVGEDKLRSRTGPAPDRLSPDLIEAVIRRRGSSRHLAREPMPAGELVAILANALRGFPADARGEPPDAFVVANAIEGRAPGAYLYREDGSFASLRHGELRNEAAYLCLEQRLGADAAAVVFLMARLQHFLAQRGGRGYRLALLEAAVAAGRIYLGAYAQCLGASGITFYDDEVSAFFDAPDRSPMLAVCVGPEGRRRSIIRCREELVSGGRTTRDPSPPPRT